MSAPSDKADTPPYSLETRTGLGRCLVAAAAITAGQVVLRERPLIVYHSPASLLAKFHAASPDIQAAVLDLFTGLTEEELRELPSSDFRARAWAAKATQAESFVGSDGHSSVATRLLMIDKLNAWAVASGRSQLLAMGSKFAHSCRPNVLLISGADDDDEVVFVAVENIVAGTLLTASYLGAAVFQPSPLRRIRLKYSKLFDCNCERCLGTDYFRALPCPRCWVRDRGARLLPIDPLARHGNAQDNCMLCGGNGAWRCQNCGLECAPGDETARYGGRDKLKAIRASALILAKALPEVVQLRAAVGLGALILRESTKIEDALAANDVDIFLSALVLAYDEHLTGTGRIESLKEPRDLFAATVTLLGSRHAASNKAQTVFVEAIKGQLLALLKAPEATEEAKATVARVLANQTEAAFDWLVDACAASGMHPVASDFLFSLETTAALLTASGSPDRGNNLLRRALLCVCPPLDASSSPVVRSMQLAVDRAAEPPKTSAVAVCAICGVSGVAVKSCGRCGKESYCSKNHQVLAWRNGHKGVCSPAGKHQSAG